MSAITNIIFGYQNSQEHDIGNTLEQYFYEACIKSHMPCTLLKSHILCYEIMHTSTDVYIIKCFHKFF